MDPPADPEELRTVTRAISLGLTIGGCCEWNERAARRVRGRPPLPGLTPEGIKLLLCSFVAGGGEVRQVVEKRKQYPDRRYYKVIVPVEGFVHGLFVELVPVDNDSEMPVVSIVNAHEQRH